ncbi:MAG: DUF2062 domain-containing protein [Pseudomonadota bacterium]
MLNTPFMTRFRALRARGHNWLLSHPRLRATLQYMGSLKGGPEAIARGVAIGLFIGLTPTVGFQTVLMLIACALFVGNFPAAFALSFVSNPLTMAPLYWLFHVLGETVFAALPPFSGASDVWFLRGVGSEIVLTLLGSLLIAGPAALAGYLVSRRLSRLIIHRRRKGPNRRFRNQ